MPTAVREVPRDLHSRLTRECFEALETAETGAEREHLRQRIVRLRYVEDYTQQATAAEVGLTQAQVSRVLRRVLSELHVRLNDEVGRARRVG